MQANSSHRVTTRLGSVIPENLAFSSSYPHCIRIHFTTPRHRRTSARCSQTYRFVQLTHDMQPVWNGARLRLGWRLSPPAPACQGYFSRGVATTRPAPPTSIADFNSPLILMFTNTHLYWLRLALFKSPFYRKVTKQTQAENTSTTWWDGVLHLPGHSYP